MCVPCRSLEFQCGARKSQCMSAISAGKVYLGKLAPINIKIHGPMQHSPLQLRQKLIDTVDDKYHSTASSSTRHHKKSKRKKYKNHVDEIRSSKSDNSNSSSGPSPSKSSRYEVGNGRTSSSSTTTNPTSTTTATTTNPSSKLSRDPLTDDNKNTTLFLFDEESRNGPLLSPSSDLSSIRLRNNKTGMSGYGSSSVSVLGEDDENPNNNSDDEEEQHPPSHRSLLEFGEELLEELPDEEDNYYEKDDDDPNASSSSSSSSWVKGRTIDVDSLHTEQVPNVNGNLGPDGQFYKWHETYAVPSINGELLHILPYTVIDF